MSEPCVILQYPVGLRKRVEGWLARFPGTFRGFTENEVMKAARDAFDRDAPLNAFEAALRSCGYTCDAARRTYDAEGKPSARFIVQLRLPERPRGA